MSNGNVHPRWHDSAYWAWVAEEVVRREAQAKRKNAARTRTRRGAP